MIIKSTVSHSENKFKLDDFFLFEEIKVKSINLRKIVTFWKNDYGLELFALFISREAPKAAISYTSYI
jgi:hypothetical protein